MAIETRSISKPPSIFSAGDSASTHAKSGRTDFISEGEEPPEFPTQFPEERRKKYPISINLEEREFKNELSGEFEKRHVLIVEDLGVGMDKEIIQRYFLQIGRSYYTTDEFRRTFRFIPTSRFGLGFLSVFAVSDYVSIETYKPGSSGDGALCLTLTGPRSYLLIERGRRTNSGTKIEVILREPMKSGAMTDLVKGWCKRVEFPVVVTELGTEATIVAERSEEFVYEIPIVTETRSRFAVRSFPVNRPGIEGDLYIFSVFREKGESWADWLWAKHRYPKEHPEAIEPKFPSRLVCINGISVSTDYWPFGPMVERIDYRREVEHLNLSRQPFWGRPGSGSRDPVISSRWEEILKSHLAETPLARGEECWIYKQRLVALFPLPGFWDEQPEMVRLYQEGIKRLMSLNEIKQESLITTIIWGEKRRPIYDTDKLFLTEYDIEKLSDEYRVAIFDGRWVDNVRCLKSGHLAIDWSLGKAEYRLETIKNKKIDIVCLPDLPIIGFPIHKITDAVYRHLLLNKDHPFIKWLLEVYNIYDEVKYDIGPQQFDTLTDLLFTPLHHGGHEFEQLEKYLNEWRNLPGMPEDLKPPHINKNMFCDPSRATGISNSKLWCNRGKLSMRLDKNWQYVIAK